MLHLLRLVPLLLALSCLTATATTDLWPRGYPGVVSIQVKLGVDPARLSIAQVKLSTAHAAKPRSAELEDGPEGEETPLANLVRGYDGDDQIETALGLALAAVQLVTAPAHPGWRSAEPSHPPCAGFPTGPPVA